MRSGSSSEAMTPIMPAGKLQSETSLPHGQLKARLVLSGGKMLVVFSVR